MFLAAAAVLVIGLVAVIMMKELPLRTMSGVEARREQQSAADPPTTVDSAALPIAVPEDAVPPPVRSTWRGGTGVRGERVVGERVVGDGSSGERVVGGDAGRRSVRERPSLGERGAARSASRVVGGQLAARAGLGARPRATVAPRTASPCRSGRAARAVATGSEHRSRRPRPPRCSPPSVLGPRASGTDPRDRLLALLLPDPERALTVVANAERAREAVHRARLELDARSADLDAAKEELLAQGLSRQQVVDLFGPPDPR